MGTAESVCWVAGWGSGMGRKLQPLCLGPALGKQASFCPDSHCLKTVCRGTGQAWAATLPRPQDSLGQAGEAASHTSGRRAHEGTGEKVIQTGTRKGGGGGETESSWPFLGRGQRSWREALAHAVDSGPGRTWPPGWASRLRFYPALVLACRRTSGTCHSRASVSSPVNYGTVSPSLVFNLKKNKIKW